MRKAIALTLCVMAFVSMLAGCAGKPAANEHKPGFEPNSTAVFLTELNTGVIVYTKQPDDPINPYALSQMLSALVAIEETQDLALPVAAAADEGDSNEEQPAGYSAEQLLYSLLLRSDAQAANALAGAVGGGDSLNFIARLNERARSLGATSTNFASITSESTENNYTTARDIAAIARAAVENETYMGIANTVHYSLATPGDSDENADPVELRNENRIIDPTDAAAFIEGARAVKFSADFGQGESLICYQEWGGMRLLLVLLSSPQDEKGSVYTDAKGLLGWADATCAVVPTPEKDKPLLSIGVSGEYKETELPLILKKNLSDLLPKDVNAQEVSFFCRVPAYADTQVSKGDVVGLTDIISNKTSLMSTELVAQKSLSPAGGPSGAAKVFLNILLVLVSLFILLFIIRQINIIRYRKKRLKILEEKRRRMRRQMEREAGSPRPPMRR